MQQGTSIQAKDIAITAREGNLTATGAKLEGENIDLTAQQDIVLQAATNSQTQKSQQSGSNASIGVTFGGGEQNGFSIQIGFGQQQGKMNGDETVYDNTLVTASNRLRFNSGGDTTLAGAQLAGNSVIGTVGGNLNIFSLQDSSQFNSSQSSSGFSISLCIPPICYGNMVTGSVQIAKTTIEHNYRSAQGQSGINAGSDGFDITVANHTDLKGGAITSSAEAGQNRLSTGSLSYSDLINEQNTQVESMSISAGYGGGSALSTLATNAVANGLGNLAGPGGLPEEGSERSRTLAVISPATITITGGDATSQAAADTLTQRDASTANQALKNTLTLQDAARIQEEMKKAAENAQAAQMAGAVLADRIGSYSAEKGWAEGSIEKMTLHGISGAIQAAIANGKLEVGAAAGIVNEFVTSEVGNYLKSQGIEPWIKDASGAWQKNTMFDEFLKTASMLAGAATGIAVGGDGQSGQLAAQVATTNTVYNYLSHTQAKALADAKERRESCRNASCVAQADSEIKALEAIDRATNEALDKACLNPSSSACLGELVKVKIAAASYDNQKSIGFDKYSIVDNEKAEASSKVNLYETRVNNAGAYNLVQGGAKAVIGGAVGLVELDVLTIKAATGDTDAIKALSNIGLNIGDFVANPVDSIQKGIKDTLDRANALDAAGRSDEAQRMRAELFTNGILTAGGLSALATKATVSTAKTLDSALTNTGKLWETGKILEAGEVTASTKGTISAQQVTRTGVPASLNEGEMAKLSNLSSLDSALAGTVRETVADAYFTRNGFTSLDGKCGVNCFDGVYTKGDQVIINEVKPLNYDNTIKLSSNSGSVNGIGTQMSDGWIRSRIIELRNSGDPAKIATAQIVQKALDNGSLIKMVSGVNGNGMTLVKVNVK